MDRQDTTEGWAVEQGDALVSIWLTEKAARSLVAHYTERGHNGFSVARVTIIRDKIATPRTSCHASEESK